MNAPPDPAALASALATVRRNLQRLDVDPMTELMIDLQDHNDKCSLLIRWLAANAGELWRKVKCEDCEGIGSYRWSSEDGGSPELRCPTCKARGYALTPAIPESAP